MSAPEHHDGRDLPDRAEIVIVGAGLAGLAAAAAVQRAGRQAVVLERSDGVGGRVRTDVVDGFQLDRGFQVLLTAYPEFQAHFDADALDLRAFEPGALVWTGSAVHVLGDPLRRPRTLVPTLRAPVGSVADKVRLLRQRMRLGRADARALLRQPDRTTLAALQDDGFSPAMIDGFFRPFVGGIQLDPTLRTSARMFDVILQALFTGSAAVPARGMGAIPEQLASTLTPGTVHLGATVDRAVAGSVTVGDRTIEADRVVVATEGPAAARLLGLDPVPSNPATCVWFSAPRAPHDEGYLLLNGSGRGPASNIAVMTNIAPEYAPDGSALIAAACPGVDEPDAENGVRAQLADIWGSGVSGWRHLRTDTIAHGQPGQQPPFSPKQSVALGDGLFVCGDHRDTASIQGALFSGRRCGEAVVTSLT